MKRPELEPFERLLYQMNQMVMGMSDQQQQALKAQIAGLTTTNCSWAAYWIAPVVSRLLEDSMQRRQQQTRNLENVP